MRRYLKDVEVSEISVSIPSRECGLLRHRIEDIVDYLSQVSIPSRECGLLRQKLICVICFVVWLFQSLVGSVVYCGVYCGAMSIGLLIVQVRFNP